MSSEEKAEIERQLRAALETAAAQHKRAKQAYQVAAKLLHELGTGHPDGNEAFRKALCEENRTRQDYMRALKAFTDFTLYGKIPKDS